MKVTYIQDTKYTNMYRLQWEDDSKSIRYWDPTKPPMKDNGPHTYGLYNLSRAKDMVRFHQQRLSQLQLNETLEIECPQEPF